MWAIIRSARGLTLAGQDGNARITPVAGETLVVEAATREEALSALATNQFHTDEPSASGPSFYMEFIEGERTVDKRIIDPGATNFARQPPLPVMLMTEKADGHDGAEFAGIATEMGRNGNVIWMRGHFDAESEAGREAARLVGDGLITGWSPDMGDTVAELEVLEEDDEGWPIDFLLHLKSATLIGGTIAPFPALSSAKIALAAGGSTLRSEDRFALGAITARDSVPTGELIGELLTRMKPDEWATVRVLHSDADVVVAHGAPARHPDPAFFTNPNLTAQSPTTIESNGHVYGHLAAWGTCHIGFDNVCVTPPRSNTNYSYFHIKSAKLSDGSEIPVGVITIDTGHAELSTTAAGAVSHYDNTGCAVADIVCGEDEFGIWFSGALRPWVTEEQIHKLRGSALSGDWRRIGGGLELVAALAVNVAGFPITRAVVAAGVEISLVAAGARPLMKQAMFDPVAVRSILNRLESLERTVAAHSVLTASLRDSTVVALRDRVHLS